MKPFKYHKQNYKGMICYTCDTDFSKYRYVADLTIYKKGWFRGHEKEVVLMIRDIMKIPTISQYFYFDNLERAYNKVKAIIKRELKGGNCANGTRIKDTDR